MLQAIFRQPLGRLSFSLNILRGTVGVARLPLASIRARGFLTSAAQLDATKTKATKTAKTTRTTKASKATKATKVAPKARATKTKAAPRAAKPKAKKPVVAKAPKLFKKNLVPPFKRPLYGYAKFVKELRAAIGSKESLTPVLHQASPKWHALTEQEKLKYAVDHEEMQRYGEKLREWRKGLNAKERKVLGMKAKQTPRPLTAYQMLIREVFRNNPQPTFLETSALVHKTYKSLSPEEKAEYKRKGHDKFHSEKSA